MSGDSMKPYHALQTSTRSFVQTLPRGFPQGYWTNPFEIGTGLHLVQKIASSTKVTWSLMVFFF